MSEWMGTTGTEKSQDNIFSMTSFQEAPDKTQNSAGQGYVLLWWRAAGGWHLMDTNRIQVTVASRKEESGEGAQDSLVTMGQDFFFKPLFWEHMCLSP